MKPYGLRSKFRYNYRNYVKSVGFDKKKGIKNWWEIELNTVKSKKIDRLRVKKELKKLLKLRK